MNASASTDVAYKLIFAARHGQAYRTFYCLIRGHNTDYFRTSCLCRTAEDNLAELKYGTQVCPVSAFGDHVFTEFHLDLTGME